MSNILFTITAIDGIALPNNVRITIVKDEKDAMMVSSTTGKLRKKRKAYTPEQWSERLNTLVSPDNHGGAYDAANDGIPFAWFGATCEGRTAGVLGGMDIETLRKFYARNRKKVRAAFKTKDELRYDKVPAPAMTDEERIKDLEKKIQALKVKLGMAEKTWVNMD